jgi:8-oxo-dGTP pyrophosphatase MutT (NUDIX family)
MPTHPSIRPETILAWLGNQLTERPGRAIAGTSTARAAVAIVFGAGFQILFIRRAEHPDDPWSGDMAFPGGRVDPGDASPRQTAERETLEEVGLDLVRVATFMGALDELRTPPRRGRQEMIISPFVYRVDDCPVLVPDPREVDAALWFDARAFMAGEGRGTITRDWKGKEWVFPAIHHEGRIIWGLTLRMLDDLLARVSGWPISHGGVNNR